MYKLTKINLRNKKTLLIGLEMIGLELIGLEVIGLEMIGLEVIGLEVIGLEMIVNPKFVYLKTFVK